MESQQESVQIQNNTETPSWYKDEPVYIVKEQI